MRIFAPVVKKATEKKSTAGGFLQEETQPVVFQPKACQRPSGERE
jgi:hypothetical protein